MLSPSVQSLVDVCASLPAKQQRSLAEKAQEYVMVLDRAISEVLSPGVGESDGQFVASDEIIPLYGVGPNPEDAMADYRSVVVEYYETLEEDADTLGEPLLEQLRILRRVFGLTEENAQRCQ